MDIIQELTIDTVWLQSLHICDNIELLQWFIDEDITESVKPFYYFDKKWNKTGRCCDERGLNRVQYIYGRRIKTWEIMNDCIIYTEILDGVDYWFVNERLSRLSFRGISIGVLQDSFYVNIKRNLQYEEIKVRGIEIRDRYIEIIRGKDTYTFTKNGVEYHTPSEVGITYVFALTYSDDQLSRVNPNVFWRSFRNTTVAGHLIKLKKPLQPKYIPKYKDSLFNHHYTIKNPVDKQLFTKVRYLLPPIDLETALYDPKVYMSCLPAIKSITTPFVKDIKLHTRYDDFI